MSYNRQNNFGGRRGRRGGGRGGRGRGGSSNYTYSNHSSAGREICRFFIEGRCQKGDQCRFVHLIKRLGETRGHSGSIKDVAMWEARQQLFTCSSDSTVKLWNCADWSEITTLKVSANPNSSSSDSRSKHSEGVVCIRLEGSFLFVGFESELPQLPDMQVGLIRAWNLDTANPTPIDFPVSESMPFSHTRCVQAIAIAVDVNGSPTLFSGSLDGSIKYWQMDPITNSFQCSGSLEGHARGVTCLKTIVQNGATFLISASMDSTIKIWDLASLKCLKCLSRVEEGHTNAVMDMEVWISQNEPYLITGGMDKQVIVWSMVAPFNQVYKDTFEAEVTALCATTDAGENPVLLVGKTDGEISVRELPSFAYKTVLSAEANFGHRDTVRCIRPGPANTLFTAGNDCKMIAWQWTGTIASIPESN